MAENTGPSGGFGERARELSVAFERSSVAMFIVADDRTYVDANPAASQLLGVSHRELIGSRADMFYPPEELDLLDERWRGFLELGSLLVDREVLTPGGRVPVRVTGTANVLPDRHFVMVQRSPPAFRSAFENSMNAMVVVDDERGFKDVNRAACELFGRTREALLTLRLDDTAMPGEYDTMWSEVMAAGSFAVDRQIVRPDGSRTLVRVIATTNVEPGRHFATYLPIPMRLGAAAFSYSPATSARASRAEERRAGERRRTDRRTSGAPRRHLSPREREVLTLLAQGGTGEGIAHSLGLSAETIRTHVRNAMDKLEVRTRSHAIAVAIRSGEIDPF